MTFRRLLLVAGSLALLGGSCALAADDTAPVSTASQSTDSKIAAWLKDAPAASQDSDSGPGADGGPIKLDRAIHGEFGATVGTGGYRSAYGVVHIPVGATGMATVAVGTGTSRWDGGGPWYDGPGPEIGSRYAGPWGFGASRVTGLDTCQRVYQQSDGPPSDGTACPAH